MGSNHFSVRHPAYLRASIARSPTARIRASGRSSRIYEVMTRRKGRRHAALLADFQRSVATICAATAGAPAPRPMTRRARASGYRKTIDRPAPRNVTTEWSAWPASRAPRNSARVPVTCWTLCGTTSPPRGSLSRFKWAASASHVPGAARVRRSLVARRALPLELADPLRRCASHRSVNHIYITASLFAGVRPCRMAVYAAGIQFAKPVGHSRTLTEYSRGDSRSSSRVPSLRPVITLNEYPRRAGRGTLAHFEREPAAEGRRSKLRARAARRGFTYD